MQPPATEVERESRCIADSPGSPAQPRPRLDQQAVDARLTQPPAGRDAGRAAADDRDLGVIVRHFRVSNLLQAIADR